MWKFNWLHGGAWAAKQRLRVWLENTDIVVAIRFMKNKRKTDAAMRKSLGGREPPYAWMGSLTLSAGVHHDSLWSSSLPKSSQSLHARISV